MSTYCSGLPRIIGPVDNNLLQAPETLDAYTVVMVTEHDVIIQYLYEGEITSSDHSTAVSVATTVCLVVLVLSRYIYVYIYTNIQTYVHTYTYVHQNP